ncbi:short-chain fatty acid transporter [Flagellimonas aquimarina]|uniref:Short-chain fatty acid transporter n=1 Tax=Flagellimonas aquimarina TaxID=2201895 RepID=A0A316L2X4_9FLAO|nr:TIGR00366 family protein [Allomuricauda koreensis]PWL40186.1 short-chain fatty acid transporter [Allomuricauda koreensis]
MGLTKAIEHVFRRYLPSPFTIAVLLTILTIVLAFIFTENTSDKNHLAVILSHWENGIWNNGLLVFAYQMMLILVLGHVLVLSRPMERLILGITKFVNNTSNAALLVALPTMLVSFFNWGLGLIFGAILARKVGEYAQANNIPINYPLIGASGYVGLMVWHGGISGSAPIKVSEAGHLKSLLEGISNVDLLEQLPETISTSLTVFSHWNLVLFVVVALSIAITVYYLGKRVSPGNVDLKEYKFKSVEKENLVGAERLDYSKIAATCFGALILVAFLLQYLPALKALNITPNMLNFFMLGLAIILHGSFKSFLVAVEEAIGDTAGILIQFPLYFGIMGIMGGSGMINDISDFFVSISTTTTLPIFTFLSAGLVNIFVPSGGGQWAVQGPLVLESAMQLGVPLPKAVMALAYGDQVTNMLQPFWALPLLGITKLKAKEILPYTLIFMLIGSLVYISGLLIL